MQLHVHKYERDRGKSYDALQIVTQSNRKRLIRPQVVRTDDALHFDTRIVG